MEFWFQRRNDREVRELQRELQRLQQSHEQFVEFVRSFPELTRGLLESQRRRELPGLLLDVLRRTFGAGEAVVALPRSAAGQGGNRRSRFIVAAADGLEAGVEFKAGEGLVGCAIEAQRVLEREEWAALPISLRGESPERHPWSQLELAAGLAVGQEVIGAVAVGMPSRRLPDRKEMLRLIGQVAAYKLHSLQSLQTVQTEANVDGLTRILNKRTITQRLSEALFTAESQSLPLSIFLFDIDYFKKYNDRNGHMAGDQLLRELAGLTRARTRREHLLGRFGGEEFLLVLQGTEASRALIAAENVRRVIAGHPFAQAKHQPLGCISISGGIASFPEHGRSSTALLQEADKALYLAKEAGRNQICLAGRSSVRAPEREP